MSHDLWFAVFPSIELRTSTLSAIPIYLYRMSGNGQVKSNITRIREVMGEDSTNLARMACANTRCSNGPSADSRGNSKTAGDTFFPLDRV